MKAKKQIPTDIVKTTDFKTYYAMGAIIGSNPYDVRIAFYKDVKPKMDGKKQKREIEIESEVILTPIAAKQLVDALAAHIEKYNIKQTAKKPENVEVR